MKNLPFNLCIAFLACFLMNFVTPAFSSPTPTPTATAIPTPTVTATTTVTVTPTPQPPTVTTGEAEVTCGPMPLNGTVNANGLSTTVWFEYGTDSGSYSGTSSTQTVFGRENTTVRIEIDVEYCGYVYNWCTGETTYFGSDYYYYRIAAQNSAGISYGDQKGVGRDCCVVGDNWDCTPSPVLTATPEPTPIIIEEPEYIEISTTSLKLKKRQSSEVIVTLLGADGIIFGSETITATINKSGSKRISILPTSASTDENGQAKFTITAKRVGNARVTFKAGSLKKSIVVKVRR